jgi:hypothetical protein
MTPVDQSVIDENIGDCYSACLASVLDLPLADVPNFAKQDYELGEVGPGFRELVKLWLRKRGLRLIHVEFYHPDYKCVDSETLGRAWVGHDPEPLILCGQSPRLRSDGRHRLHAVVGEAKGWGFKVIHDPHPDRQGLLGEPYAAMWVVKAV